MVEAIAIWLSVALCSEVLQSAVITSLVMLGPNKHLGGPRSPASNPMQLIEATQLGDERVRFCVFLRARVAIEEKPPIEAARKFRYAIEVT